MSITHEQARKLIQWKMDRILDAEESAALSAHLHDCKDCAVFAHEIREVAHTLPALFKKQWNVQPIPLSIAALTGRNEKVKASALLTMRTAAMSLVMMVVFVSLWQFVISSPTGPSQGTASIPPVPTPSRFTAPSTSIQLTFESCSMVPYTVQENDTLASIAGQFSLSEEAIVAINQLESGVVNPAMELLIPVCQFTPTGTFFPATFTTTYTPIHNATPSTPSGRY